MAQPVSRPITSTPSIPSQQPWDAANEEPTGPWVKNHGGAASINTGRLLSPGEDNWPEDGRWTQT